jgi:hypothetical protein
MIYKIDWEGGRKEKCPSNVVVLITKRLFYLTDCLIKLAETGIIDRSRCPCHTIPLHTTPYRPIPPHTSLKRASCRFSGWLCFGLGVCLHLLFALLKQWLHESFAKDTKPATPCTRLGLRFLRTIYIYVFSLACNCHWRGVWIVLNNSFGVQTG